jgi:hypothetical protein
MIRQEDRKWVTRMLKLRLWMTIFHLGTVWIKPMHGTGWLLERMLRRQTVDNLHHAPCCPANHYHRRRLVFGPCTCGAVEADHE